MDNFWWYGIGILAAFFGFVNLENARRQRRVALITMFFSGGAGFVLFRNSWLIESSSGDEQLVAVALGFCAVSPVLGWIWWGRHGEIRRGIGITLLFLLVLVITTVLWSIVTENPLVALLAGTVTAIVPFRWSKWRARGRIRRQQKQWRRDQRQQEQQLADEQRSRAELERKQGEMLDALVEELKR